MGLLEKLKNTFFEEEYVEVEEPEKPIKEKKQKETIAKKIIEEPKVVEKEEVIVEEEEKPEVLSDKELLKSETNFKYFEDDDFVDEQEFNFTSFQKSEPKVTYNNPTYGVTKEKTTVTYTKTVEKVFKPTPIISPIYGILDKNYTKDEIPEKKEIKPSSSYVSRRGADLDSIRRKAYGDLAGDFDKKETFEQKEEEIEEDVVEDNLLYDMTDIDTTPAVEKVTLADAEEYFTDLGLEYNVDYKDSKYEKSMGRRVNKTPNLDEIEDDEPEIEETEEPLESSLVTDMEDEAVVEDVEVPNDEPEIEEEEIVAVEEPSDNEKLEDNLFELIDSMYEDKE